MSKSVGVEIIFDDVEYTDEERDILWGRFFMELIGLSKDRSKKDEKINNFTLIASYKFGSC